MRAFILAAALVVGASSAWADDNRLCGPLGLLEAMLAEEFGEHPVAHQMAEGGYAATLPESLLPFVDPMV